MPPSEVAGSVAAALIRAGQTQLDPPHVRLQAVRNALSIVVDILRNYVYLWQQHSYSVLPARTDEWTKHSKNISRLGFFDSVADACQESLSVSLKLFSESPGSVIQLASNYCLFNMECLGPLLRDTYVVLILPLVKTFPQQCEPGHKLIWLELSP